MTLNDRYIPAGLDCPEGHGPGSVARLAEGLSARSRPARSVAEVLAVAEPLAEVARRWLDDRDPIRREALERLPDCSPFPRAMWDEALEAMFAPVTAGGLDQFVHRELDGHLASDSCGPGGLSGGPRFPGLLGQVLAGNVPAPAVQTVFCGLLAGSSQLVKMAEPDRLFPVLLARSVAAVSEELGGRLAVLYWPGESVEHNRALAENADAVVVFGDAASIASWRKTVDELDQRTGPSRDRKVAGIAGRGRGKVEGRRSKVKGLAAGPSSFDLRPSTRVLRAHGPRTSVELIELPADDEEFRPLAEAVARDVAMYDQQGCLSPQQVYLAGCRASGDCPRSARFAELLGSALGGLAERWPTRPRDLGTRLAIRRLRESYRIRGLVGSADDPSRPWLLAGPADRFDWTLLGTAGRSPQVGPGGRTVFLTRVGSLDEAADAIAPLAAMIQGVALHADRDGERLTGRLAGELHIPYVCRPGELQRPPFGWPNDNIPPLRSLLS